MRLMVEIENVPEIQKYEGVVDSIVSRLNSLGYWVSRGALVASDYGVPQSRKRFFNVGKSGVHRHRQHRPAGPGAAPVEAGSRTRPEGPGDLQGGGAEGVRGGNRKAKYTP